MNIQDSQFRPSLVQSVCSLGSLLLGGIFLWAAVSKMSDLAAFAVTLKKMTWLPGWILVVAVFLVPALELVVGLCLLCRIALREALLVGLVLLAVYSFVAVQGTLTGIHGCGCFKIGRTSLFDGWSGWWQVARNAVLTLICAAIFRQPRHAKSSGVPGGARHSLASRGGQTD